MSAEIRASEIKKGDLYREPGMDARIAWKVKPHGDTVLIEGTEGERDALDIDTVVSRYSMDEISELIEEYGT